MMIFKIGREKGVHTALAFICSECGYSVPTPITPEDRQAQLQKEFVIAVQQLEKIQRQMQKPY